MGLLGAFFGGWLDAVLQHRIRWSSSRLPLLLGEP